MAFSQAALYHTRRRRLERFRRLGLKLDADARVPAGTGIASPISDAQGAAFGAVIMELEALDGPIEGDILTVNGFTALTISGTDITIAGFPSLTETQPHEMGAFGFYTLVMLNDPPNNRADLYINGRLICRAAGSFSLWGGAAFAWDYADSLTGVGQIRDAEIVLLQVPGVYVV